MSHTFFWENFSALSPVIQSVLKMGISVAGMRAVQLSSVETNAKPVQMLSSLQM